MSLRLLGRHWETTLDLPDRGEARLALRVLIKRLGMTIVFIEKRMKRQPRGPVNPSV